jgi:hypothetical protein
MPAPLNGDFLRRVACPACGAASGTQVFHGAFDAPPLRPALESFYEDVGGIDFSRLSGHHLTILRCPSCGSGWQQDAPDGPLAEELYERWIDPELARKRFHYRRPMTERMLIMRELTAVVDWQGGIADEVSMLDLGAGWGEWMEAARGLGCPVAATELSASRRRHLDARGILAPRLGQRFQVVNLEQVLEHVPDPAAMLSEAVRWCSPGGIIRAVVPNARDLDRRLRRMDWQAPKGSRWSLNLLAPLEHVNAFTPAGFRALAKGQGCQVLRIPWRSWRRYGVDPARPLRSVAAWVYYNSPWTTHLFLKPTP